MFIILKWIEDILDSFIPSTEVSAYFVTNKFSIESFDYLMRELNKISYLKLRSKKNKNTYVFTFKGITMGNSLEAERLSREKYVMENLQHLRSKVKFFLSPDGKIEITVFEHIVGLPSELKEYKIMFSKRLKHIKKLLYHKANRALNTTEIEDSTNVKNLQTYLHNFFRKNWKLCDKPWFKIESPDYQKLTLFDEKKEILEADSIKSLRIIRSKSIEVPDNVVLYQHWGPDIKSKDNFQCRVYSWLDNETSKKIANIIKKSSIKNIILLFSALEPGSIRIFTDTLNIQQLDMLGLFWYFSGDNITDDKETIYDIAYAVDRLSVKRLSILTGEFDNECETKFSEKLAKNKSLKYFSVFQKDDNHKWPKIQTPKIENIITHR